MKKKQIATVTLGLWLSFIAVAMLIVERFDLALFFVLGFIGFLVIVELMEPYYVKPRLPVVYPVSYTRFGIVLFGAIVGTKNS